MSTNVFCSKLSKTMKVLQNNLLEILSSGSFAIYFIFNFIDRSISNIFLLIALFICLVNYQRLLIVIRANYKLVISVFVFSFYISFAGFYHNSAISELDNYYRFLLLLPLLSISFNERYAAIILLICAIAGLMHAIYVNAFFDNSFRLHGTSNNAITFGHMCATLSMICIYYIFYKHHKPLINATSAIIFLILLFLTETRGPIIGIFFVFIYLAFVLKRNIESELNFKTPLFVLSILLVSIMIIPNPLGERLKDIGNINLSEPLKTDSHYLRERAYYIAYGIEEIKDNYVKGVGPQNVQKRMSESLELQNIDRIKSVDHLHNDFLDIILKFGFISIILLFFIYFFLINKKNKEHSILLNILMIMLLSSQLTQSQFAHHQAITFFIALLYLLQSKKNFN